MFKLKLGVSLRCFGGVCGNGFAVTCVWNSAEGLLKSTVLVTVQQSAAAHSCRLLPLTQVSSEGGMEACMRVQLSLLFLLLGSLTLLLRSLNLFCSVCVT